MKSPGRRLLGHSRHTYSFECLVSAQTPFLIHASPSGSESASSGPQHHVLHGRKKKSAAHCGPRRHCCLIGHFMVPSGLTSLMTSVTSDPHNLLTRVCFGKDQKYSAEGPDATHSRYDWHQLGQLYLFLVLCFPVSWFSCCFW